MLYNYTRYWTSDLEAVALASGVDLAEEIVLIKPLLSLKGRFNVLGVETEWEHGRRVFRITEMSKEVWSRVKPESLTSPLEAITGMAGNEAPERLVISLRDAFNRKKIREENGVVSYHCKVNWTSTEIPVLRYHDEPRSKVYLSQVNELRRIDEIVQTTRSRIDEGEARQAEYKQKIKEYENLIRKEKARRETDLKDLRQKENLHFRLRMKLPD